MKIRNLIVAIVCLAVSVAAFANTPEKQQEIVEENGKHYLIHNVVAGESLYAISRFYGFSIPHLESLNPELAERGLLVGQRLRIPYKKRKSETKAETKKHEETDAFTGPTTTDADDEAPKEKKPQTPAPAVDSTAVVPPTTVQVITADTTAVVTPATEVVVADSTAVAPEKSRYDKVTFRKLAEGEVANIALMLPLGSEEQPAQHYVDFYRGFLIGLDSVRMSGKSANVRLYNTAHDHNRVSEIIASGVLDSLHLVVGPIYEDELIPVAAALKGRNVPIVSPLANLQHIESNAVFQMSPSSDTKFSKLGDLRTDSTRVVVITTEQPDEKFEAEVRDYFKDTPKVIYHKYTFLHPKVEAKMIQEAIATGTVAPSDFIKYLRDGIPTVFIVTASTEMEVDRILNKFSQIKKAMERYGSKASQFVVVGNNRWNNFKSIDRTLFFTVGMTTLATYSAHRSIPIIKRFDKRFIREFGALPTRYAYRGYDAAVIFVNALYGSIENNLEGERLCPLVTPYTFHTDEVRGLHINSEWSKVHYNNDFKVTVE
jgi:LysM repeat protein